MMDGGWMVDRCKSTRVTHLWGLATVSFSTVSVAANAASTRAASLLDRPARVRRVAAVRARDTLPVLDAGRA